MKKALIITTEKMPQQSAGAVRLESLGKICAELCYHIDFFSLGNEYIEKGDFTYYPFGTSDSVLLKRVIKRLQFNRNLLYFLENKKYDICIYTEVKHSTQKIIKKYCKKNNIKLIYDCVEWFSPSEFKFGKLSYLFRTNDLYNRKYLNKQEYIISISTYLNSYFKSRKLKTICIPAIMDTKDYPVKKALNNGTKNFLYAGSPGRKDEIDVIVKTFLLIANEGVTNYKLDIVGCSLEQFFLAYPEFRKIDLGDCICFHGRIERNKVMDFYKKADFSVLMRDSNQRFAKAGFPTKFAESMTNSTPVIANISSDLDLYLKDAVNGFVVESNDVCALKKVVFRALSVDEKTLGQMCAEARKTAEKCFDYKNYVSAMKDFICL